MIQQIGLLICTCIILTSSNCSKKSVASKPEKHNIQTNPNLKKAYFASGCFWCVEAVFESVNGVEEVISGYSGGTKETATYEQVGAGYTDHCEAVEVYYDASIVDYKTLLTVFFDSHDPTTLHRQGPDAGRQYRSAIFYQNNTERDIILAFISELEKKGTYKPGQITTEVSQLEAFYPAEEYHQDYEKLNPNQPYVRSVSIPRLNKFKAKHPELLKSSKPD